MVSIEGGKDSPRVKAACRFNQIYHDNPKGDLTICYSRWCPRVCINVCTSACINYTYRDKNTHTHIRRLHSHTICYKHKIFYQKIIILQKLDWIDASPKTSPSLLENSKFGYNSNCLLTWKTLISLSPTVRKTCTVPLRV